ncbi:MAG: adenylosuccinate synthase [Chloroflexi bacterium]|nr:adenylosuccinate synthase [Chloroflexota bacterium]
MPAIVVIGAHWGDEGKGKIVDMLSQSADMVARFSGGDNAGHTVINHLGEFSLHQIPTGIFCPNTTCVIGNGAVVNAETVLRELEMVEGLGIDVSRFHISDKAHLVLPYHLMLDGAEEASRGDEAIGTTKRGIGPAYTDKVGRVGLRTGDLLDTEVLSARLGQAVQAINIRLQALGAKPVSFPELFDLCQGYAQRLRPYIRPVGELLNDALAKGKTVIFEGAQGTLLDLDFGTYPFVTSSSTTAQGVYTGAGIRPRALECVLGVFKAYTTRVGTGPMPTELLDETGELIRQRAKEFGTTTGRARRCGWFDAVAGRYGVELNGMTAGALTRLDVLDDFPIVRVCVAYELDGQRIEQFPTNQATLDRCKPIYEDLPGWLAPTPHLRQFDQLPRNAQAYIHRLEELVGCEMKLISVGPRRDETIHVKPLL